MRFKVKSRSKVRGQIAEVPLPAGSLSTSGKCFYHRGHRGHRLDFYQGQFYLRTDDAFGAIRLGAGIGDVIALAIEGDDEHGTSVAIAVGLVGSEDGSGSALRSDVAGALAETTMAELVGAAEKFDEVIGAIGSEDRLHGAVMLVAKR